MTSGASRFVAVMTLLMSVGCTTAPPLVLLGSGPKIAPAGPKVASLMANLKCELWDAANSTDPLPYYEDGPTLTQHKDDTTRGPLQLREAEFPVSPNDPRTFNLRNLFQEIEYVGDVQLTLDVTGGSSFNPSMTASKYYRAMMGVLPATGMILSVGGQLGDTGHRNIQIDTSVDFSRINTIPKFLIDSAFWGQPQVPAADVGYAKCDNFTPRGLDLGGQLYLKQGLATAVIAVAMNDLSVSPDSGGGSPAPTPAPASGSAKPTNKQNPDASQALAEKLADLIKNSSALTGYSQYLFGTLQFQTDFTIVEGVNGGPNWTLNYVKFPSAGGGGGGGGGGASGGSGGGGAGGGAGGGGLINFNRQVKDTLLITMVPVCIREKYSTSDHSAGETEDFSIRYRQYKHNEPWLPANPKDPSHDMMVGTPYWANSLPPRPPYGSSQRQQLDNAALGFARYNSLLRFPSLGQ